MLFKTAAYQAILKRAREHRDMICTNHALLPSVSRTRPGLERSWAARRLPNPHGDAFGVDCSACSGWAGEEITTRSGSRRNGIDNDHHSRHHEKTLTNKNPHPLTRIRQVLCRQFNSTISRGKYRPRDRHNLLQQRHCLFALLLENREEDRRWYVKRHN